MTGRLLARWLLAIACPSACVAALVMVRASESPLPNNTFEFVTHAPAITPALVAENCSLTFEKDIRPILRTHCFECHGAETEKEGNLDLRLRRFQLTGGDSGPAIVPGDPENSLLLQRIHAGEMPPKNRTVGADQLAKLEAWIAAGAPTRSPEPESIPEGSGVSQEDRAWWSFQPIRTPPLPMLRMNARLRTPIDAFLAAAAPASLTFTEDASKRTFLKRISFDLIGLPPSSEEVQNFLNQDQPDAVERLGDRLLASPHYGERWARHWLDVVGYADSEGGTPTDAIRPHAYHYRDYVIDSFNQDKPFDQLIEEQLAGDEMAGPIQGDLTDWQIELLTATGYLRMAVDGTGSGDSTPEARHQVVVDTIKIMSTSLLGLSMACAQCHDHRYDPILHRDYYSMRAIIDPAFDCDHWKSPSERLVSLYTAENKAQAAVIEVEALAATKEREALQAKYIAEATEKQLGTFEEPLRSRLRAALDVPPDQRSPEEKMLLVQNPSVCVPPALLYQYNPAAADDLKKFDQRIADIRARKPEELFLQTMVEPVGSTLETRRFHRGDYRQPLEVVPPALLTVLAPEDSPISWASAPDASSTTRRRLAFARWLTGPDNPLTLRVLVNRFWMHQFGRAIVATPADFGRMGTPPTNPALLDWLADDFRSRGWSLKNFHREVIASTAYRQSSTRESSSLLDPENRYLTRHNVKRLDAEILRDRVLTASGMLDTAVHGKPVPLLVNDAGETTSAPQYYRRSLYTTQRRSQPVALLAAFDAPVMQTNCESRTLSTVATQSLMLMNGNFLQDQAYWVAIRACRQPAHSFPPELIDGIAPLGGEPVTSPWQFGYGSADTSAGGESFFLPFKHWTGSAWQEIPELPNAETGHAQLHARGGHPGRNSESAVIRRWTAPKAETVSFSGTLQHLSEVGDGVRGRIILNRQKLLGEWICHHGEVSTNVTSIAMNTGNTLDFVTDARENDTADSFEWVITFTGSTPVEKAEGISTADSFHGLFAPSFPIRPEFVIRIWELCYLRHPSRDELTAAFHFLRQHGDDLRAHVRKIAPGRPVEEQTLTNLAHVLMNSNEFLYVD